MKKRWSAALAAMLLAGSLAGCGEEPQTPDGESTLQMTESSSQDTQSSAQTEETASQTQTETEESTTQTAPEPEITWEQTGGEILFSHAAGFYEKDLSVSLMASGEKADGAVIYYTLDGSTPTASSEVFSGPITLMADRSDFPNAYCLRAKAVYADGTESAVYAHTFFLNQQISDRFSTVVFSVSGDPRELTEGPDGIFFGENYSQRGRESERAVYVEAFTQDGQQLLGQFAGVRIFGGASRESSIKSMKLFARKSYDSEHGSFKLDVFGTPALYEADRIISKYDKLVLRNGGNDFQFAYLRDELCQVLAKNAGFTDYEAVIPAVGYLNGSYYGFYWLHENYCDDYFKEKYGDGPGNFIIIEGTEQDKDTSDKEEGVYAREYQQMYEEFETWDMTDDASYEKVRQAVDVENYLDYFAFNIYLCNYDWPQNNYKCYRYYAAEGENYGEGVFDGRWRYLPHDIDFTLGLYDQREVKANYDMLKQVLNEKSDRYAPLFAALMQREDCRTYFIRKTLELQNGALSMEGILSSLEEMQALRDEEQWYYYKYLEKLRNNGDSTIWSRPEHMQQYIDQIENFAKSRPEYSSKYLMENFDLETLDSVE